MAFTLGLEDAELLWHTLAQVINSGVSVSETGDSRSASSRVMYLVDFPFSSAGHMTRSLTAAGPRVHTTT